MFVDPQWFAYLDAGFVRNMRRTLGQLPFISQGEVCRPGGLGELAVTVRSSK